MNRKQIEDQLKIDEGYRLDVYPDQFGNPTVGIGHFVRPADGLKMGDIITPEDADAFFQADLDIAICYSHSIFPAFDQLTDNIQGVIVNMMFNLGFSKFRGFNKFITDIKAGDYLSASAEMVDSAWYRQVGERAQRLEYIVKNEALA